MSMVFCRGCGKPIHETAPTCPSCGAPQGLAASRAVPGTATVAAPPVATADGSNPELESLSNGWKEKFALLEKAGGVKLPNFNSLPFGERLKVIFNIWGFLFGPIYYLVKGMRKKALTLFGLAVLIVIVLEVVCRALRIPSTFTNFVASAIFATRANIDFYKKVKLRDNDWW